MKIITNGIIITPQTCLENHVMLINDDHIEAIMKQEDYIAQPTDQVIDAQGGYIMPGFIDIHSDYIETMLSPRPTAMIDFEVGLTECEKVLASQGITTMFHSLSLYQEEVFGTKKIRMIDNTKRLIQTINQRHNQPHLIRHRVHARLEIDHLKVVPIIKEYIAQQAIHLLSFMDHTPGQGQYKDLEIYKKSVVGLMELSDAEAMEIIKQRQTKTKMTHEFLTALAQYAQQYGISLASHDDDSLEKLEVAKSMNTVISEFPITLETAKQATKMGLYTVAGAPNILLGGSHSGNLSALDGIKAQAINIIASDYYPFAMIPSLFKIYRELHLPLHEIVALFTLNPAKAVQLDHALGSLTVGKKADFLIVSYQNELPTIQSTFVNGIQVYQLQYR